MFAGVPRDNQGETCLLLTLIVARQVSVVRYAFTVRDSHPLLLAGLPAHFGFVLC